MNKRISRNQLLPTRETLASCLFLFLLLACKQETSDSLALNPIQQENQLKGTTSWMLDRVQQDTCEITEPYSEIFLCRSKPIEGYCSATSVAAGENLSIFVSTDPPSPFKIDFYRMGYYQGKGGRLMKSTELLEGKIQPVPDDGPNNLKVCDWESSYELAIPDDWLSGVYLGKMEAQQSGLQAYVIFIVRDNRETDFLFQCSDITWQAYNRWPQWRSLYDWVYEGTENHNPWHVRVGADVSFDRPYAFYMNSLPVGLLPLTNGSGEFLLWEFPLAFWLESRGYDVSYFSNIDTHTGKAALERAAGLLSVGHDEYWTAQMKDQVTLARDNGLSLLFLGGNSVLTEVGFKAAGNGLEHRVFGRTNWFEDEQQLMGASSYGVGLADWTCQLQDHWVFEGTGMKQGDVIKDFVGWEYHGYPLGDIPGIQVLASGPMYEPEEGNLYAATYYELPKGNFVFNAATCWWNMALSSPPGFPHPLNPKGLFTDRPVDLRDNDKRVQRMTRNMLDRIVESPD